LSWRLPLYFYKPESLFHHASKILSPGGFFFMVNQGEKEAYIGYDLCVKEGMISVGVVSYTDIIFKRRNTPVLSLWQKAP